MTPTGLIRLDKFRFRNGPRVVGYEDLGPPAMDGKLAVVAAGYQTLNRVVTLDARDGTSRVVARTSYSQGMINFVAVDGRWVMWVDQSRTQGDGNPDVFWKIVALNLDTHHRKVLGSSGSQPNPFVPRIYAGGGSVVWATAEPDRSARLWRWRVGSDRPVTVKRHAAVDPSRLTMDNGVVFYLGPSDPQVTGPGRGGGDCWSMRVTGGTATRLTHSDLTMNCQVGGGWLVYEVHADPEDPPPVGLIDDPYEVWAQQIGSERARLLHRGYVGGRWPQVGNGFTLWSGGSGLAYSPLGRPGPSVTFPKTRNIIGLAASGEWVAYVASSPSDDDSSLTFGVLAHRSSSGKEPTAPQTTTRVTPPAPIPDSTDCRPQNRTEGGECVAPVPEN